MGEAIYRDYDADALYAQYNNRAMTPADVLADIKAKEAVRADEFRAAAKRAQFDIAYGPHPRERLDLFMPDAENPPLFAYIHGGYWQWNDKEPFSFLPEQLVPAGAAFANIEYELCPNITLTELTQQIRRALAYLWREAGSLGFDRDRIVVSGHSAGGHLTAMMMATDWPAFGDDLPVDLVSAGLPVSGIYDIEPLRLTPLNDAIRMDAVEAKALSPVFMAPPNPAPMIVVYGGDESEEFDRQAKNLADAWRTEDAPTEVLNAPGRDHFTVLNALTEPGHDVLKAALRLLGL
ncbi:MAG: alpha/beta hydrolase [Rhodospirillaceae bacterium]|jgi:arylformamidase|nr:alpha/beta hydrolase [Rhodospirillaceae bacterium]